MCASVIRDSTGRGKVQAALGPTGVTISASSACECAPSTGVPGGCGKAVITGSDGGKVNLHFKGPSTDAAAPVGATVEVAGKTFPIGLEGDIYFVPKSVFVN